MNSHVHVIKGEKAKMIGAWGTTATEAFAALGPVVDEYIKKDWILQGINVYSEYDHINLTATISREK